MLQHCHLMILFEMYWAILSFAKRLRQEKIVQTAATVDEVEYIFKQFLLLIP